MKNIKEKILELRKQGISIKKIAEQLNVSEFTVQYHIYPKLKDKVIKQGSKRFKDLSSEEKKEYNISRREYNRNYMNKKYENDLEFKEKHRQKVREYMRKKRSEGIDNLSQGI